MNKQSIKLIRFFKRNYRNLKIPSLTIYQNRTRIYLDEYPEQKALRKEFFAKRWNLQNKSLKGMA